MRIAQLAPPLESVPPTRYGGTERVIHTLTEELVRRGHDVTLFASADSRTSARLVATCQQAMWHRDPPAVDPTPAWSLVQGKLLRQIERFDVVHSHLDHFGFALARYGPTPVVTTLHGRLDLSEVGEVLDEFSEVPLVSISDAQRRPVPRANFVSTVYHGIALDEFTFRPEPGKYLVFLGRVGMPLKVAARMPLPTPHDASARADRTYWRDVVKPMLGDDIEFIGEVGGADKDALLGNALALLFPIRWPEPFGLVMVEALACGTPVLALRQGSVPEVIRDRMTGRVVDTEDELVDAVDSLSAIDRGACREEAETRFSPCAMAAAYERVYADLATNGLDRDQSHAVSGPASPRWGVRTGYKQVDSEYVSATRWRDQS